MQISQIHAEILIFPINFWLKNSSDSSLIFLANRMFLRHQRDPRAVIQVFNDCNYNWATYTPWPWAITAECVFARCC